jgi:hypothetical protein
MMWMNYILAQHTIPANAVVISLEELNMHNAVRAMTNVLEIATQFGDKDGCFFEDRT